MLINYLTDNTDNTDRVQLKYSEPLAISRTDNLTPICTACGIRQALSAAGVNNMDQGKIVKAVEEKTIALLL